MNNLNVFILFSTLIYFKLEENKSGNLKVAVGLVALYALYNLLKGGVEGWNPYTYVPDGWFQDLDGQECETGKGTFVQGASPPEFPYDHCKMGEGDDARICGNWNETAIMNLIGSPSPGQASPSFQYTDSNVDQRCKTVVCEADNHCIGNSNHKYCHNGKCSTCKDDEHCGSEDLICVSNHDNSEKICVNKFSAPSQTDISDYGMKRCFQNTPFYTRYSPSNNSICSSPPPNLNDDAPWVGACCVTPYQDGFFQFASLALLLVVGIFCIIFGGFKVAADKEKLYSLMVVVGVLIILIATFGPSLSTPPSDQLDIDQPTDSDS